LSIQEAFRALPVVLNRTDTSLAADDVDIVVAAPGAGVPAITNARLIVVLLGRAHVAARDASAKLGSAAVVVVPD